MSLQRVYEQVDNLKSVDNFWVDAGQFPDFCRDEVCIAIVLVLMLHEEELCDLSSTLYLRD